MSGTATARTRSRSRAMARRSGSSRGWLMRARRSSALRSAAISGSALPVMELCCIATRIEASMSDTAFSSRERDMDRIRSSSWSRCRATSDTRASISATLAAASRAISSACLASTRASEACSLLPCWRLTSSISRACTRCCVSQPIQRLPPATSAITRPTGMTHDGSPGAAGAACTIIGMAAAGGAARGGATTGTSGGRAGASALAEGPVGGSV